MLLAWLPIVVGHEAQTVNSAECHRADRERAQRQGEEVPFSRIAIKHAIKAILALSELTTQKRVFDYNSGGVVQTLRPIQTEVRYVLHVAQAVVATHEWAPGVNV